MWKRMKNLYWSIDYILNVPISVYSNISGETKRTFKILRIRIDMDVSVLVEYLCKTQYNEINTKLILSTIFTFIFFQVYVKQLRFWSVGNFLCIYILYSNDFYNLIY